MFVQLALLSQLCLPSTQPSISEMKKKMVTTLLHVYAEELPNPGINNGLTERYKSGKNFQE